MAILKGLITLIIVLAIMGGAIVGSYIIAQNNPFDGQHKHQLSFVESTDPTCDQPGTRQHYKCNDCGGVFADGSGYVALTEDDVHTSPLGHSWLEASCGSSRICEYCDAEDGEKQAHKPGSAVKENIVPATCISEGAYNSVIYCSACGEKISSEHITVGTKSHTPGLTKVENEKAATCYSDGSYESVVFCAVDGCSAEISRTIIKTGKVAHTPSTEASVENKIDASCSEVGSYDSVIYCAAEQCGAEISREKKVIPALGHIDENRDAKCDRCTGALCATHTPVIDAAVAATCTSDGFTEGSHCSYCGEIIVAQQVIPAAHKLAMSVSGALTINRDGSADTSELVVTMTCTACNGYTSDSAVEYAVNTANAFTDGVVITSGDLSYTIPALDLVKYDVSSTYNVGTYNDRTPTVTTVFALKGTDLACKVISGDAINLIGDGSASVYSRYEVSKLCNENVTVTYDETTGYHYASKKAHTVPFLLTYGATLTVTGTVEVKTTHRVSVNNGLIIGTDDVPGYVTIERTQLVASNNHVLGLYGGGDLTIKNGTLTAIGMATSEWAVDLYVGANGTIVTIEKNGSFITTGKGEYAIYVDSKDTQFIVDGTIVANKPFHFKATLVTGDQYEYGFNPSLYIRHGSVTIDTSDAVQKTTYLSSLQLGSEKENASGYLSISSSKDLIYLGTNSRITFAKGTLDFNCTVSGKAGFNTAGASESLILDVKKGMTVNSTGLAHVFGLWSNIAQCWMIEEGATFNHEGSLVTNNNSSVTVMLYKTAMMNIDGASKQVVVASVAKKSYATPSAFTFPGIDSVSAFTTDTSAEALYGFIKAVDANGNSVYYK